MKRADDTTLEMDKYYLRLSKCTSIKIQKRIVAEMFSILLKAYDLGQIPLKRLAYSVCGIFMVETSKEHMLEEIVELACELELPETMISDHSTQSIRLLEKMRDVVRNQEAQQ